MSLQPDQAGRDAESYDDDIKLLESDRAVLRRRVADLLEANHYYWERARTAEAALSDHHLSDLQSGDLLTVILPPVSGPGWGVRNQPPLGAVVVGAGLSFTGRILLRDYEPGFGWHPSRFVRTTAVAGLLEEVTALLNQDPALAASPQQSPISGEGADLILRGAMQNGSLSFTATMLADALRDLVVACEAADMMEELPEQVDGSLLDAANRALSAYDAPPVPSVLVGEG